MNDGNPEQYFQYIQKEVTVKIKNKNGTTSKKKLLVIS